MYTLQAAFRRVRCWRIAALLVLAACAQASEPDRVLRARTSAIVYGTDDRVDVYAYPDPAVRELAKTSLVALVPRTNLKPTQDGSIELTSQPLEAAYSLCPGDRFATQPSAVSCSGVLIGADLVLTAAHCLRKGFGGELDCQRNAYVFDYFYAQEGELEPITDDDVFACREIVVVRAPANDASVAIEYAVVQLDRAVAAQRKPAVLRRQPLSVGEPLVALSFPSGLPAKIDPGAQVFDTRRESLDFFRVSADTFGSSSGGGLFDRQGALAGVLVRGGSDFELSDGGCWATHTVPDSGEGFPWEEATYAWRARDALCDTDRAPTALCSDSDDPSERTRDEPQSSTCALSMRLNTGYDAVFAFALFGACLTFRRAGSTLVRDRRR